GDGNLHLYALRDELPEDEWKEKLHRVFQYMYDKGKEFKGKVSGEHGIGLAKKPYLEESLGEQGTQLMRNIKHAFDSKNILNPGKVI
ncbi:MAG: 2-hydroxy-acid oxidase, partial [bacterium]|nr:2-hydroxy-acid oxidase [bacterium]